MPNFTPHGDFVLKADGQIMHMWASGPTNVEQMELVGVEVNRFLDSLGGKPCGVLVELGEHSLLTSDAAARCDELMVEHMQRGLCAAAFVVHAAEFREFIIGNVGKLYNSVGLTWEQFETVADAREWLDKQVALADSCHV